MLGKIFKLKGIDSIFDRREYLIVNGHYYDATSLLPLPQYFAPRVIIREYHLRGDTDSYAHILQLKRLYNKRGHSRIAKFANDYNALKDSYQRNISIYYESPDTGVKYLTRHNEQTDEGVYYRIFKGSNGDEFQDRVIPAIYGIGTIFGRPFILGEANDTFVVSMQFNCPSNQLIKGYSLLQQRISNGAFALGYRNEVDQLIGQPLYYNQNNGILYVYEQVYGANAQYSIVKYDVQNNVASKLITKQISTNTNHGTYRSQAFINGTYIIFYISSLDASSALSLKEITFNLSNETITETALPNILDSSNSLVIDKGANIKDVQVLNHPSNNNIKYFIISFLNLGVNVSSSKAYIVKQDKTNNICSITDTLTPDNVSGLMSQGGLFPLNESYTYQYLDNAVKGHAILKLVFDVNTDTYKQQVIEVDPTSEYAQVGIDSLGRIQIADYANDEVKQLAINVPYKFDIKFAQEYYEYDGTNIPTNLIINIFDYAGNRVATRLELTIDGAAVFADNSKKTVITTSDSADTIVPITITGPGYIEIFPKIIL